MRKKKWGGGGKTSVGEMRNWNEKKKMIDMGERGNWDEKIIISIANFSNFPTTQLFISITSN